MSIPPTLLAPGRITRAAHQLREWDTTRPILRFDFPAPEAQASFHRAFAQIRTPADHAAFMTRFRGNYDAQVQIPRRILMDTSNDEALAQCLHDEAPPPPTDADAALAQEMQARLAPILDTGLDEEIARGLHECTDTTGDEELARRLQEQLDIGSGNEAVGEEVITRRMQARLDHGGGGYGGSHREEIGARFGGMDFNGRGPTYRSPPFRRFHQGGHVEYGQYRPRDTRLRFYYEDEEEDDAGGAPYPRGYSPRYDPGYGGRGYRYGGY
ncbi:hypothetical protein BDW02DRAFT_354541 [Decorospora gaudefroyi]|uniref:Uncharacterized protein n=1 Tax=Decorospora gaudefroyi TaxID=184978 RepID=A0A6A5KC63_9PLEO|nr:hypothetical protein BDW02DRAFT_354541 [Decorospora gaudefroyi]